MTHWSSEIPPVTVMDGNFRWHRCDIIGIHESKGKLPLYRKIDLLRYVIQETATVILSHNEIESIQRLAPDLKVTFISRQPPTDQPQLSLPHQQQSDELNEAFAQLSTSPPDPEKWEEGLAGLHALFPGQHENTQELLKEILFQEDSTFQTLPERYRSLVEQKQRELQMTHDELSKQSTNERINAELRDLSEKVQKTSGRVVFFTSFYSDEMLYKLNTLLTTSSDSRSKVLVKV